MANKVDDPDLLSTRLRYLLRHDHEAMAQLRGLERIAAQKVTYVAGNSKFPHWSFDHWMKLVLVIWAAISTTLMSSFMLGSRWERIKTAMDGASRVPAIERSVIDIQVEVPKMRESVDEIKKDIEALRKDHEFIKRLGGFEPPRRTPVFGR